MMLALDEGRSITLLFAFADRRGNPGRLGAPRPRPSTLNPHHPRLPPWQVSLHAPFPLAAGAPASRDNDL